jgi:hypothetical protein
MKKLKKTIQGYLKTIKEYFLDFLYRLNLTIKDFWEKIKKIKIYFYPLIFGIFPFIVSLESYEYNFYLLPIAIIVYMFGCYLLFKDYNKYSLVNSSLMIFSSVISLLIFMVLYNIFDTCRGGFCGIGFAIYFMFFYIIPMFVINVVYLLVTLIKLGMKYYNPTTKQKQH